MHFFCKKTACPMHGDIIVEFNIDTQNSRSYLKPKIPPFTAGIILGLSRYPWKSVLYLRWPCFHCEGNPAETKATGRGGKVNNISRKCSSNLNTSLVLSRRYLTYMFIFFHIYIYTHIYIYFFFSWNLFDLYFWPWTIQKKAISTQNKGHFEWYGMGLTLHHS